MQGKIRIIGGQWRGRKLSVPDKPGLRPTPQRTRETLFNWLTPWIGGAFCVDLFAGSGALGLEAASRGALRVVLVEKNKALAHNIQNHARLFNAHQVELVCRDAQNYIADSCETADIFFLDPPFSSNLLLPCCESLEAHGRLHKNSLVYLEMERVLLERTKAALPACWHELKRGLSRETAYLLMQRQ